MTDVSVNINDQHMIAVSWTDFYTTDGEPRSGWLLTEGYDTPHDANDWPVAERIALADAMIERWQRYRAELMAE